MDNMVYLFVVYAIIWAIVFGYVFYLIRKQGKLRRDFDLLKDSIDKQKM